MKTDFIIIEEIIPEKQEPFKKIELDTDFILIGEIIPEKQQPFRKSELDTENNKVCFEILEIREKSTEAIKDSSQLNLS